MDINTGIDWNKLYNKADLFFNDRPVHIENFLPNPENFASWAKVENALNENQVWWNIIQNQQYISIPEHTTIWGERQQDKHFLKTSIDAGLTFVIDRYSIHDKFTKQLCLEIEQNFNVTTDIHLYGGMGSNLTTSFIPHIDENPILVFHAYGECEWVVYENHISHLYSRDVVNDVIKNNIDKLNPILKVNLKPGDLLYLPERTCHVAYPKEPRLSLNIGCFPQTNQYKVDKQTYKINKPGEH